MIAWEVVEDGFEIDRLAVDPAFARRRLVQAVPPNAPVMVSTGEANAPAVALYEREGFVRVGSFEVAPNVVMAQFRRDA